jgi:NADPH-dependent glutamate synthase beta subunit-like oxidoreductase
LAIESTQEFLVQPVDASWLQCNIECQEACPVGTNCRGYLNLAAEGRFEEGYILSREPNPVAAMCSYVCSAPCERACRRGDIDRPLAIRAMKRFLVEWHEASGIPDVMPQITPRAERVAVVGAGPAGLAVARELAMKGYQITVFDSLPFAGGTMSDSSTTSRSGRTLPSKSSSRISTRSPSPPVRWTRSPSTSRAPSSKASTTGSTS